MNTRKYLKYQIGLISLRSILFTNQVVSENVCGDELKSDHNL